MARDFVFTLSCPDRVGIVAAVASTLAAYDSTITDSQQYGDPDTGTFFLRIGFRTADDLPLRRVREVVESTVDTFGGSWHLYDAAEPMGVVVMVSKQGHVLNRLLFGIRTGQLPVRIAAVVSNHPTWAEEVRWHGIDFHHVPVTPDTKADSERFVLDLMASTGAETLVLARYMQILSDQMCRELEGRAINIHHSLLPSFKGARPYEQAHRRGVKVIGATAHYVTADLDEGPIIGQEFLPVDHRRSAAELARLGQNLEADALVDALSAHAQHRVLLNGVKTVVFD